MKILAQRIARFCAMVLVFPAAIMTGFGRWHEPYVFFANAMALIPGILGSYLRVAYYGFTLDQVGPGCHIAFGTYFAHAKSSLGARVGIGAYCVLGQVDIGEGTLLASRVQILSGARQHMRDENGHLTDAGRQFKRISVGPHCWIGAGAIVMADLGEKVTVGPGSFVRSDVPAGGNVSGNPARNFAMVVKPTS